MEASFPPNASPFALVYELHNRLLRAASDAAGLHFHGLQQAARHLRKAGLLDAQLANKLASLDLCFNWMRHMTAAKASSFEGLVRSKLAVPPAQQCRASAPQFVPAQPQLLRLADVLPPPGLAELVLPPVLPSAPPLAAAAPAAAALVLSSAPPLPSAPLEDDDLDDVNIGTFPSRALKLWRCRVNLPLLPPIQRATCSQ